MSTPQTVPPTSPTPNPTKTQSDHDGGFLETTLFSPIREFMKDVRRAMHRTIALILIVCTALMIWKGLIAYSGSESPVVVVLSGSMEPTFYKGDILTLSIPSEPYKIGDIVVFKIPGREIPIVHRVLEIHDIEVEEYEEQSPRGNKSIEDLKKGTVQRILTKGDNNDSFDRPLYMGQTWIRPDQILGKARLILPSLGHITILLTEYPYLKFALLGLMGWFVLTAKE